MHFCDQDHPRSYTGNITETSHGCALAAGVGLLGMPWDGEASIYSYGHQQADVLQPWEVFAWVWNALRFVEEFEQLRRARDRMAYFRDVYNQIDLSSYLAIGVAAVVRLVLAIDCNWPAASVCQGANTIGMLGVSEGARRHGLLTVQFAYGLALLLLSVRMINMLKADKDMGVLIIMLGEMTPQIVIWSLVSLTITVGFSLFLTVVMPGEARSIPHTAEIMRGIWPRSHANGSEISRRDPMQMEPRSRRAKCVTELRRLHWASTSAGRSGSRSGASSAASSPTS